MSKTVGIMQPYFFPYIGYWQLMNAVDQFVLYDNVQFTKKGWINRNRYLKNGKVSYFSLPTKKDSDFLDICERYLSDGFEKEARKILRQIESSYKRAPYFDEAYDLFEDCLMYKNKNLFEFLYYSIIKIKKYLAIDTEIIVSSHINCDHSLKSGDRVKEICKALDADRYFNPIGGIALYSKKDFNDTGICINFHKSQEIEYQQFENNFEPWLSILDVLMFNDKTTIHKYMNKYSLI